MLITKNIKWIITNDESEEGKTLELVFSAINTEPSETVFSKPMKNWICI